MTCRLLLLLAISLPAFAQDDVKPAAPVSTMELADGDSIVFLGDSITHQPVSYTHLTLPTKA